jgi:phosphoribosylaminoimidazole-succinocarboxamide synthase
LANGIVPKAIYLKMEEYTRALFQRGTEMAAARGLILVDTKYEFGIRNGEVILIDEIHTPDSSRYFYAEGYQERQDNNEPQKQLSKEFVRQWLIENNFQGLDGQTMPVMPDEFVTVVTDRYIELYEMITGNTFEKADTSNIEARIQKNVTDFLSTYNG